MRIGGVFKNVWKTVLYESKLNEFCCLFFILFLEFLGVQCGVYSPLLYRLTSVENWCLTGRVFSLGFWCCLVGMLGFACFF